MILVLLLRGKDALSSKVKKDNCWLEQNPENWLFRYFWDTRYNKIPDIELISPVPIIISFVLYCIFLLTTDITKYLI